MFRPLIALLILTTATAAELPDPWVECQPRQAIAALAALRAPLDAAPDDQDLLGRAIMAYVNLALGSEPGLDGACGPWLDYARELAVRRARVRGGEPATLAEAAPELWLRLLDGDAVGTMAALERWKDQRDQPLYRALAGRATRDVRIFRKRAPETPHERMAALQAIDAAGTIRPDPGCPPFDPVIVHMCLRLRYGRSGNIAGAIRAVYTDVAWMLRSPDLPDAAAMAAARDLLAGCGVEAPAEADRAALCAQAIAAVERLGSPARSPLMLAAAVATARAALGGPRGVMDGAAHRLVGLGDVAAWNRDRLYLAGWLHLDLMDQDGIREFTARLRERLPDSVITARIAAGQEDKVPPAILAGLAEALVRELDDPTGISPGLLAKPFHFLATRDRRLAATLAPKLLAARHRRGVAARTCLVEFSEGCRYARLPQLTAADVLAVVARDPWHQSLHLDASLADTDRSLLSDPPEPSAVVTHPTVDFRDLPFTGIAPTSEFALRWRGFLRIETAGAYRLGIESDDGSRLRVGGLTVDNGGRHGMQVRNAVAEFAVGWHPLDIEYVQGGGGAGCRLLWQPPGAKGLEAVPAAALAHGEDRQPGLRCEVFIPTGGVRTLEGPSAAEIAAVEAMPWLPKTQTGLADRLFQCGRYDLAVAAFDRVLEIRPLGGDEQNQFSLALLGQTPRDDARIAHALWKPECRRRDRHRCLPPAQIRTGGFPAYGSSIRW